MERVQILISFVDSGDTEEEQWCCFLKLGISFGAVPVLPCQRPMHPLYIHELIRLHCAVPSGCAIDNQKGLYCTHHWGRLWICFS